MSPSWLSTPLTLALSLWTSCWVSAFRSIRWTKKNSYYVCELHQSLDTEIQNRKKYYTIFTYQNNDSGCTPGPSHRFLASITVPGMHFFLFSTPERNPKVVGYLHNTCITIAQLDIPCHPIIIVAHSAHKWVRLLMRSSYNMTKNTFTTLNANNRRKLPASTNLITPSRVTKMCGVLSNRFLSLSSGLQLTTMAVICILLDVSRTSPTNNSKGGILHLALSFTW